MAAGFARVPARDRPLEGEYEAADGETAIWWALGGLGVGLIGPIGLGSGRRAGARARARAGEQQRLNQATA